MAEPGGRAAGGDKGQRVVVGRGKGGKSRQGKGGKSRQVKGGTRK